MKTSTPARVSGTMTIALCLVVALLEGLDLQSTGVAAPRMAREFHLAVAQMGWAFSIGAFGLLPGAAIGGRLADRLGRKRVLMLSVGLFGIFSIATTQVWNLESLLAARFLTGLGLGAAMPNLIALCSEAAAPHQRSTAVGAMYCGMPFGAALAALIGIISPGDEGWRHIFYVGGIGPLLILPLLALCMKESEQFIATKSNEAAHHASSPGIAQALFQEGRAGTTVALWISYLGTLIVLYFLINWLPSMVLSRGLTRVQSSVVQMMFNIGGGIGAIVIASMMDRIGRRPTVIGMYIGISAALAALASASGSVSMACGGLLAGLSREYPLSDANARHGRGCGRRRGKVRLDSRAPDRGSVARHGAKRFRAGGREHSAYRGGGSRGAVRRREVSARTYRRDCAMNRSSTASAMVRCGSCLRWFKQPFAI